MGSSPGDLRSRLHGPALAAAVCAALLAASCAPAASRSPKSFAAGRDDPASDTLSASASASADTSDWRDLHATRVSDLLEGRFAGVEVISLAGGGTEIHIRGVNTLLGSTEPLFVIDGEEVESTAGGVLNALNPNDIARIQVLKDASATALYGIRGANGVIVITTKRGN